MPAPSLAHPPVGTRAETIEEEPNDDDLLEDDLLEGDSPQGDDLPDEQEALPDDLEVDDDLERNMERRSGDI